jgi:hypothetical protein
MPLRGTKSGSCAMKQVCEYEFADMIRPRGDFDEFEDDEAQFKWIE